MLKNIKIASSTLLLALYANWQGSWRGDKQDDICLKIIFSKHFMAMGVSATGLRSFKVDTFGFFGTGIISAVFQPIGTLWTFKERLNKLILIGTTYQRSKNERSLVLDRFNQAKLNKPISKQALKRWFSDEYLEKNPATYDHFMQILNKNPLDHQNFLKAYELFATHKDDIQSIQKIMTKTLVMTGSKDEGSTPFMSKELVKDLPNSNYMEIMNGKHLCSIEYADDVNIKIKNFITN